MAKAKFKKPPTRREILADADGVPMFKSGGAPTLSGERLANALRSCPPKKYRNAPPKKHKHGSA